MALRRLLFLHPVRMLPCLLLVLTSTSTRQSLISSPMPAAQPTALLHSPRFAIFLILCNCFCFVGCVFYYHSSNCFLLILQVINDRFGIVEGLMTTVHSITGEHHFLVVCCCIYWLIYILVAKSGLSCCFANQLPRRLLMDHQPKTGEVEELLHLTSFLAALELPR